MSLGTRLSRTLIQVRSVVPALGFTVGLCSGQALTWFLNPFFIIVTAVVVGLIWSVGGAKRGGAFLGIVVGMVSGGGALVLHPPPVSGADVQVLVRVEETPRRRIPGEVVFIGREILGEAQGLIRCRAVDLPWRSLSTVEQGDVVWVRGSLVPIARPLNPLSWDGWLWRRGISGELKVMFASKPLQRAPSLLGRARRRIIDSVVSATEDSRGGALFLSMALGVRDILSPPVEGLFTSLGLSHLLVVSGYQVSLVFGAVFSLLVWIGKSLCSSLATRNVAIAASLVCATLYVLTIGAEMSSFRALTAALCLCVSLAMNRRHGFAQRLVVTFMCMHIVWPWALFEVGVVLTFAALAGIGIGSVLGAQSRFRSLVWVTVAVWGLTSTVTVVWNGTVSVSGLFLNLALAAPWSVLNCTLGVGGLALLLMGISGADSIVRAVGQCNEAIVSALFYLQHMIGVPHELSLYERGATAMVLVVGCAVMVQRAIRLERGRSLRVMVRGNTVTSRASVRM
jgi:ComEC/Rec2-related protein